MHLVTTYHVQPPKVQTNNFVEICRMTCHINWFISPCSFILFFLKQYFPAHTIMEMWSPMTILGNKPCVLSSVATVRRGPTLVRLPTVLPNWRNQPFEPRLNHGSTSRNGYHLNAMTMTHLLEFSGPSGARGEIHVCRTTTKRVDWRKRVRN